MFNRRQWVYLTCLAGAVTFLLAAWTPLGAVDFIRGDANGDGVVSVSDFQSIMNHADRHVGNLTCLNAGDTDSDGDIDLSDGIWVLNRIYLNGPPVGQPFPLPGPQPPGVPDLGCESYGGSPLIDPAAKISVRDFNVIGGDSSGAFTTLSLSSSTTGGGFAAWILDEAGVISRLNIGPQSYLVNPDHHPFMQVQSSLGNGRFLLAMVRDLYDGPPNQPPNFVPLPAGGEIPFLRLRVCLKEGVPAGTYPLKLESGELTDWESGRAISSPQLQGGTFGTVTVLSATTSSDCGGGPFGTDSNVRFLLSDAAGEPGTPVTVRFSIRTDRASQGFSFSIDFDEGILYAETVEKLFQRPDGMPNEYEQFTINNEDATPGNGGLGDRGRGIEEGYLSGVVLVSSGDDGSVLPPDEDVGVLDIHFSIKSTAERGTTTQIRFLDEAKGISSGVTYNSLFAGGQEILPEQASSFVFIPGTVSIIGDITIFVRGDSNGDSDVDIADAQNTLNFLFLGGSTPPCMDAADSNDDGQVDIADPVATLGTLFLGSGGIAAPYPNAGRDGTPDTLSCGPR